MIRRLITSIAALSILYIGLTAAYERDAVPFLVGPPGDVESEVGAVKETLDVYNSIFTDLFATNGAPEMLNEFPASKQLKHEVFRNIGALRSMKRVLVFDRATMKIKDIEILSPTKAEAVVLEEWNYVYQDAETRSMVSKMKGMGHGFKYILRKAGDKWLVTDYYPVDVDTDARVEGEGHN